MRLGLRVAAVGGLVRDLLLDRAGDRTDLDLVVEGSAAPVAHRLAQSLSGRAVEHPAFLTATVTLPDGRRIDLTTARRESYRAPGALPSVEPASLADDLARRDFSLNALAIRLDRADWGRLVDATGGLPDLRARRIRVLHPLLLPRGPHAHPARGAPGRAARMPDRRHDPTAGPPGRPARRLPGPVGRSAPGRARPHPGGAPPRRRPARGRPAGRPGPLRPRDPARPVRRSSGPPARGRARAPGASRHSGRTRRSHSPSSRSPGATRAPRPGRDGWPSRPAVGDGDPPGPAGRPGAPRPARARARPGRGVHDPGAGAGADPGLGPEPRGGRQGSPPSRRASLAMASAFAAGDGGRPRRARHVAGAGHGRAPAGAPGRPRRRTCAKPGWCVTLAQGRRRPGPRARGSIAHPTG